MPAAKKLVATVVVLLVALLASCRKPTQKQLPQEPPKLGDTYAKAALLALLAIQSDASIPESRHGEKLVTGSTQSKIDAADVEATTTEEESITKVLRQIYEKKLEHNSLRRAEGNLLDTMIKNYPGAVEYHRVFPNQPLIPTKADIRERAAKNDRDSAEMSKREAECFEPFAQMLRARLPLIPKPCTEWIGGPPSQDGQK